MVFKILKSIKDLFTPKTKNIVLSENVYIWIDQVTYGKYQSSSLIGPSDEKLPLYWITSAGHILVGGQAFEIKLRLDLNVEGATVLFERVNIIPKRDNGAEYLLWCQSHAPQFIKSNAKTPREVQELIYNKFYNELDVNNFSYKDIKKLLFLNKKKVKKDFFNNFLIDKQLQQALVNCNIKKEHQYLQAKIPLKAPSFSSSILSLNSSIEQKPKKINKI